MGGEHHGGAASTYFNGKRFAAVGDFFPTRDVIGNSCDARVQQFIGRVGIAGIEGIETGKEPGQIV